MVSPTNASVASGHPGTCKTFPSQLKLLLRKNLAVIRRNKLSTFVQYFIMIVVIIILFIFDADDKYNTQGINKYFFEATSHPDNLVGPMARCEDFNLPSCVVTLAVVFAQSFDSSSNQVDSVLKHLYKANTGVKDTVIRYNTSDELNEYMLENPGSVLTALHFPENFDFTTNPQYTVQLNQTAHCAFGSKICSVPWEQVQLPLQVATETAILQAATDTEYEVNVKWSRFPNPNLTELSRDISQFIGPILVLLACIANFVIQLNQLIQEKEAKLKLLLRISGVSDSAMWASWWMLFFVNALWAGFLWWGIGSAFGLDALSQSDFGVIFFLFFLFYLALAAWACFLSTLIPSMTAGYALGFVLCIGMWLFGGVVNGIVFSGTVWPELRNLVGFLFPPLLFGRAFDTLNAVSIGGRDGMRWAEIVDDGYRCPLSNRRLFTPCDYNVDPLIPPVRVLPIGEIYVWFVVQVVVYGLLAIYLDQIVDTGYGRPQKWYFLFQKAYWFPHAVSVSSDTSTDVVDDEAAMDEDVLAESERVQSGVLLGLDSKEDAIRVVNLKKTFFKGKCSKVEFTAVFRVNVGIKNESLFCLLGHNGAGKTTTFNMLSGILEPTRGDAFVFGKSVKHQLRSVQSLMGICPQHDIQWPELSAQDHLNLFAGLANLPASEGSAKVAAFIKAVDLVEFGSRPSRTYSGGMKRRLSVACSLIADPSVVYLDEPTTGMDPVNRRGVWDVIEKAKHGRVVVLTTHAMEEADTLGDVISIMSRGRLHCLGTALRLKNKYGTGYHVDIEATEANRDKVLEKVREMVPSASAVGEHTVSANVKLEEVAKMQPLCEMVERDLSDQGVQIAVSMCTLETVFISIAEAAGDPELLRVRTAPADVGTSKGTEMSGPGPAAALTAQAQLSPAAVQAGPRSLTIQKPEGQKVGLDLSENEAATGCVVKLVHPGFAAAAAKNIFAGDVIVAVAGTDARALSKPQVLEQIRAAGSTIQMDVERSEDLEVAGTAANTATSPVPLRPVVMDEVSDHGGVLAAPHLEFRLTPFSTQFMAVASKSKTNLKRQCCQTTFFTIGLPGLFLTVYTLIKFLPGLIIGGNTLVPGVESTRGRAVDSVISNPNSDRINEAYRSISQLIAIRQGCIDEDKDTIAASQFDRFEGWAFNHLCANQYASTLAPAEVTSFAKLRSTYDCDTDFWDYIYPQYQYARDATQASDLEKMPNITYETLAGETFSDLSCPEAYGIFLQTCDLPKLCPSNYTDNNDLSPLMQIYAKAKEYNCSKDAAERLEQYEPGQYDFLGSERPLPANVTNPEVATCMSERFFCNAFGEAKCSGAPAFLNFLSGDTALVECSTVDYPDSTSAQFLADNGGTGRSITVANECISDAATFCKRAVLFDVCPRVVLTLEPKITPVSFGPSTSNAEKTAFGELIYKPDSLEGCTDCYQDVLEMTPDTQTGMMGQYTIQFGASLEDNAIAMANIQCVDEKSSMDECSTTRDDLDEAIYTYWADIYASYSTEGGRQRRGRGQVPTEEGKYQGAYHIDKFELSGSKKPTIDFTVLYNGTIKSEYGPAGSVPNEGNEEHVPALVARMMSLIYNQIVGTQLKGYVMGFPSAPHTFLQNFSLALSWVFAAILGFMQIILTAQIVAEKATNMREIMTMSGLGRRPYWVITWLYSYCLYLVCLVFFFIISFAFDFKAITAHNFGVILVIFMMYCAAQTSYACFASTLFSNKWGALVANFFLLVFIFVLMGWQLAEKATGYDASSSGYQFVINILPTFAMSHISEIISHAGIGTFTQLNIVPLGFGNIGAETAHPLGVIMGSLIVGIIFWMAVAVYFDMVLPIGPGIKRPATFLFHAETWKKTADKVSQSELDSISLKTEPGEAPEVSDERQRVLASQQDGVRVIGLSKIYPGSARYAVKNVQFGIMKDECFGLLGSNGAGKTTTIHVLCGLHPPTTGTVICGEEGLDIRVDLGKIQSSMGVCSQDNLLWDDLTGPEHQRFFGRLRRLNKKALKEHIDFWLSRVNLNSAADRRKMSRSYSGGMKRRLNTANAFIGNPKLVYLDEPSTGLDPESRQQLWRAVLAAKPGKSIILTTHALEEAEALCDRVGIMTFGLMRTLGTPNQLRLRFDKGYKFMIAIADPSREATAQNYVKELMPASRIVDSINGVHTYVVPKEGVQMSTIFSGMITNKDKYHIKDWGLSHTTLEEVFLQIVSVNPINC